MNRMLAVPAAAVVALTACTGDPDTRGPATNTAGQCDAALDSAFTAWEAAGFSGSVAISTRGEFDCVAGYGTANEATGTPNTADTVFSIGSITKAFTAAAVFDLVDDGALSVDARAGDILPELTGPVAGATIRQLLLHTSGLSGSHGSDYEPLDRDAALAAIDGLQLAFEPGSGYVYSNAGYTLLALIVEKVSRMSYREHAATRILPLADGHVAGGFWNGEPAAPGPRAVGYFDDGSAGESGDFAGPHWALDGNGGLAMTTRDLAAWTHQLFTGQLVSPESAQVISSPGFDLGEGRSETPGWVAHDASVFGEPLLATAGGGGDEGHDAVVGWLPERDRVVAIASNTAEVTAEELLDAVGPSLLAGDPLPTPDVPVAGTDPTDIVGMYELDTGGSLDVTASEDRLAITASGADAVAALFPPPDDVSVADLAAHEERVLIFLSGQTQEGSKERAALESSFGPIADITLAGTIVRDGDVRTYVTIVAGAQSVVGWYSLDAVGGITAAEAPSESPTLLLVPSGVDEYRPDDPTDAGPDLTVEFADDQLTIIGPAGTTVARTSG